MTNLEIGLLATAAGLGPILSLEIRARGKRIYRLIDQNRELKLRLDELEDGPGEAMAATPAGQRWGALTRFGNAWIRLMDIFSVDFTGSDIFAEEPYGGIVRYDNGAHVLLDEESAAALEAWMLDRAAAQEAAEKQEREASERAMSVQGTAGLAFAPVKAPIVFRNN